MVTRSQMMSSAGERDSAMVILRVRRLAFTAAYPTGDDVCGCEQRAGRGGHVVGVVLPELLDAPMTNFFVASG
jgi:hypothetical protein